MTVYSNYICDYYLLLIIVNKITQNIKLTLKCKIRGRESMKNQLYRMSVKWRKIYNDLIHAGEGLSEIW